jgi:hypothetical protein
MIGNSSLKRIGHVNKRYWDPIPHVTMDAVLTGLELGAQPQVLDIRCGRGELLSRVTVVRGAQAIGVDHDAHALEEAALLCPSGHLRKTSFASSDVEPASFDFDRYELAYTNKILDWVAAQFTDPEALRYATKAETWYSSYGHGVVGFAIIIGIARYS